MKNINKLALLLTIPFVVSCGSSNTEPTNTAPQYVSAWGEEYAELIVGSLGIDLPYIENEKFQIQLSEDDFGDPLVMIYVYEYEGHTAQDLMEEYAAICADSGYAVVAGTGYGFDYNTYVSYSYPMYYADGWINDVDAIEIQFLEGADPETGEAALGIFAFNYIHYDEKLWPTKCVEKLLGHDVPQFYDESYGLKYFCEFEIEGGLECLYIKIEDAWADCEYQYLQTLIAAGYLIDDSEYEDGYGYYAYPTDVTDHVIQFAFTYGYGLEIFIFDYEFDLDL